MKQLEFRHNEKINLNKLITPQVASLLGLQGKDIVCCFTYERNYIEIIVIDSKTGERFSEEFRATPIDDIDIPFDVAVYLEEVFNHSEEQNNNFTKEFLLHIKAKMIADYNSSAYVKLEDTCLIVEQQ